MSDDPNMSNRQGVTDSAVSSAAEVGQTLIQGITPADKGWILGFIVVVGIIVGSDMWVSIKTLESNRLQSDLLTSYFIEIEQNRSAALERQASFFDSQVRRSQEVIRDLAQAVARDSERAGIAALTAIEAEATNRQVDRVVKRNATQDPNFIGPPTEGK